MEELHALLHSLSRAQLRLLRNYLTCFSSRGETDAKTLQLMEILLREVIPTVEECSREIYDVGTDSRILKLKSRFKSKVLDALLLDINLEKKTVLDRSELVPLKLRKKIAQMVYLYHKIGAKPIVKQLIDEVIYQAKQFEYYEGLIEALKLKKYFKGFRIGEKEFNAINKELRFYEACIKAVDKALDYYYLKIMKTDFKGNVNEKFVQKLLRDYITDLKKDYEYTLSATVGFYLKFLEQSYFENSKDYNAARDACVEQLAIVNNNVSVYRKRRVGIIYDNIAQYDILIGDYEKAINNTVAAQKHFIKKSVNFYVSKEIEFQALFHSEKYQRAKTASAILINTVASLPGDFRYAKFRFFRANVLFMLMEIKEALKLLSEKQELSKDKAGWDIAIRILTILCHIELENFDLASQLIDGLRKHIDRQGKVAEIRERDKLIARALQLISKRGFAQGQVSEKELELLRLLASNDKRYKWEALTPEIIPFHQWAIKKYRIALSSAPAPAKEKRPARSKTLMQ